VQRDAASFVDQGGRAPAIAAGRDYIVLGLRGASSVMLAGDASRVADTSMVRQNGVRESGVVGQIISAILLGERDRASYIIVWTTTTNNKTTNIQTFDQLLVTLLSLPPAIREYCRQVSERSASSRSRASS
jgi:hypothetical protein